MNPESKLSISNPYAYATAITDYPSGQKEWMTYFTKRICVRDQNATRVISLTDIIFMQSHSNYTMIHTTEGKILHSKTLKFWEETIQHTFFVRVHHSFVINKMFVSEMLKTEHILVLRDKTKIPVSRRNKILATLFY